jgi:hypothetical protein
VLLGDLAEWSEFIDAGIYREHIDPSRLRPDGCKDAVEVGEICGIPPDRLSTAADRGDRLVQFELTPAGDKDAGAFFGKTLAMPRPIPALPPVTSATLLTSLRVTIELLCNAGSVWFSAA